MGNFSKYQLLTVSGESISWTPKAGENVENLSKLSKFSPEAVGSISRTLNYTPRKTEIIPSMKNYTFYRPTYRCGGYYAASSPSPFQTIVRSKYEIFYV